MLSLFRINDPLRLLLALIVLVAVRLPYFIVPPPLTHAELQAMLIGEKMMEGARMYADIWDQTGPLSAGIYWLLVSLFGKSISAFRIFALLLAALQLILVNYVFQKNEVYNEKGYLPALFYALFMGISFDMALLSPAIIALTFLILLSDSLFTLKDDISDDKVFGLGVIAGMMLIAFLPASLFLILAILGFIIFRSSSGRQFILASVGVVFPLFVVAVYYYWHNSLGYYLQNFIFGMRYAPSLIGTEVLPVWLFISGVPLLFILMAIVKTNSERVYINYQISCQNLMLFWFILGLVALVFSRRSGLTNMILLAPVFAFFMAHYFMLIKREWVSNLLLLVLVAGITGPGYVSYFFPEKTKQLSYNGQIAQRPENWSARQKKVLVIGYQPEYYVDNKVASPYLDWQLASVHFKRLDSYQVQVEVLRNISNDLPDIIVDAQGFVPVLFSEIPLLKERYAQLPGNQLLWFRKAASASIP